MRAAPNEQRAEVPPRPEATSELLVFLQPGTDPRQFARDHGVLIQYALRSDPNAYVVRAASPIHAAAAHARHGAGPPRSRRLSESAHGPAEDDVHAERPVLPQGHARGGLARPVAPLQRIHARTRCPCHGRLEPRHHGQGRRHRDRGRLPGDDASGPGAQLRGGGQLGLRPERPRPQPVLFERHARHVGGGRGGGARGQRHRRNRGGAARRARRATLRLQRVSVRTRCSSTPRSTTAAARTRTSRSRTTATRTRSNTRRTRRRPTPWRFRQPPERSTASRRATAATSGAPTRTRPAAEQPRLHHRGRHGQQRPVRHLQQLRRERLRHGPVQLGPKHRLSSVRVQHHHHRPDGPLRLLPGHRLRSLSGRGLYERVWRHLLGQPVGGGSDGARQAGAAEPQHPLRQASARDHQRRGRSRTTRRSRATATA